MAQEWYYTKDGKRQGPITPQQLKQLAAAGDIQPTDLIWSEGQDEWKPAQSIKGLFSEKQSSDQGPPPIQAPAAPSAEREQLIGIGKKLLFGDKSPSRVIQRIAWFICGLVIVLGGLLFLSAVSQDNSAIQEAAAGAIFSTVFIAAYVLARTIEKFTNL